MIQQQHMAIIARRGFNPLALNPILYLTADDGPLLTGDAAPTHNGLIAKWTNRGVAASDPLQGTAGNQPIYKDWDATNGNYVSFPKVSGNYVTLADDAAVRPTGDMELTVKLAATAWTGDTQIIAGNGTSTHNWRVYLISSGALIFNRPVGAVTRTFQSTAAVPFSAGEIGWIKVKFDQDNGASASQVDFETSADGDTWTPLGAADTDADTGAGNTNVASTYFGSANTGTSSLFAGRIFRVIVKDGIGGTTVLDVNPSIDASDADASFTATTGQTVTVNTSLSVPCAVVGRKQVWFDGATDFMDFVPDVAFAKFRAFIVARKLGAGGESGGRVLSLAKTAGADNDATGANINVATTVINVRWNLATRATHTPPWDGSGVIIEVIIDGTGNLSRVNNVDELTWAVDASALDSDLGSIGGQAGTGAGIQNPAMALYELAIYDPDTFTDANRDALVSYLNTKYSVY